MKVIKMSDQHKSQGTRIMNNKRDIGSASKLAHYMFLLKISLILPTELQNIKKFKLFSFLP